MRRNPDYTSISESVGVDRFNDVVGRRWVDLAILSAMTQQPYRHYVQRIDASRNMARYYSLAIQSTLFGEVSLLRCWGRIGAAGQEKVHFYERENDAVEVFLRIVRQKRARGYRPISTSPDHVARTTTRLYVPRT